MHWEHRQVNTPLLQTETWHFWWQLLTQLFEFHFLRRFQPVKLSYSCKTYAKIRQAQQMKSLLRTWTNFGGKCLLFFPWYLKICVWETNFCFWAWIAKVQVKIMTRRGFIHLSIYFFFWFKKTRQSCYACLSEWYIHFIGKLFAHHCFLEQKYWAKKKKYCFSIFLSKFNLLNLKVGACSYDSSSTVFIWSYYAAFFC